MELSTPHTLQFYRGERLEAILDLKGVPKETVQVIIEINESIGRSWEWVPEGELNETHAGTMESRGGLPD